MTGEFGEMQSILVARVGAVHMSSNELGIASGPDAEDCASRCIASPAPAAAARIYSCFDFRLSCELPLPELAHAEASDGRPLVEARMATLPASVPRAGPAQWNLQVAGHDALLAVPRVARFLIRAGREILIDPHPGASERRLRLFLLGSALGILAHQRGLVPLHANAVVVEGGAYAFCGPSGAGKSTLAAHFQKSGYELLCDDVCPVAFDADDRPLAWPGVPRLKLWSEAAQALGHDPAGLDLVADDLEKYHLPVARLGEPRPVPLRRLYVLGRAEEGSGGAIVRLTGRDAMRAVLANTYRGMYLPAMGLGARHFGQCAAMLRSIAVYRAPRVWGFEVFEREAERLERHIITGEGE
jgi:hypothetical protein